MDVATHLPTNEKNKKPRSWSLVFSVKIVANTNIEQLMKYKVSLDNRTTNIHKSKFNGMNLRLKTSLGRNASSMARLGGELASSVLRDVPMAKASIIEEIDSSWGFCVIGMTLKSRGIEKSWIRGSEVVGSLALRMGPFALVGQGDIVVGGLGSPWPVGLGWYLVGGLGVVLGGVSSVGCTFHTW